MRKRDRGMPEVIFVGHPKSRVAHRQTVFLIEAKDADGVPTKLRMLRDDETVTIEEGMEFMTGYVQAHMLEPR